MTEKQSFNILKLHKIGLTNRKIAKQVRLHHKTVGAFLKSKGLSPNGNGPKSPKYVTKNHIRCSKCNKRKFEFDFLLCRPGQKYEYRLSYCNECRKNQSNANMNSDKFKILRDIYLRTKHRSKARSIKFNLKFEDLKEIYNKQKGLCFYSAKKLSLKRGSGMNWESCTIDKVIPQKGYIKTNIVLCTKKYNSVKNDLSLVEIKKHMPYWYNKLRKCKWLNIK